MVLLNCRGPGCQVAQKGGIEICKLSGLTALSEQATAAHLLQKWPYLQQEPETHPDPKAKSDESLHINRVVFCMWS